MYVLGEVDPTVSIPKTPSDRAARHLTAFQFIEEAWSLYGIGLCVLFLRFAIRLRTVGIRGFRGDDAFAFLLIIFFTLDAVTVHEICEYEEARHKRFTLINSRFRLLFHERRRGADTEDATYVHTNLCRCMAPRTNMLMNLDEI